MTDPNPAPASNPDADELAALRKEKTERDAAAQAERERELEELRQFKADQEKKAATAVKPPATKVEKAAVETPAATPIATPPAKRKRRSLWWSDPEN